MLTPDLILIGEVSPEATCGEPQRVGDSLIHVTDQAALQEGPESWQAEN